VCSLDDRRAVPGAVARSDHTGPRLVACARAWCSQPTGAESDRLSSCEHTHLPLGAVPVLQVQVDTQRVS
jgi:hypothetical protein